jgi:hypothetical protein
MVRKVSAGRWAGLSRDVVEVLVGGAEIGAVTITAPVMRHSYNRWGATAAEVAAAIPGDGLVPHPKITSTRAITVGAPPDEVWAWLVQIGQGRGGFYSFDALENMYPLRCDIHSADQIIPQLQDLHAGDLILLAPAEAPCFRVAAVEPPRALVLAGADPKSRATLPVPATSEGMAHAWQWVLRPAAGGRDTRLVVRQRYCYPRRQAALWHLVEAISFVMERRMLYGIKARAEGRHPAPLAA